MKTKTWLWVLLVLLAALILGYNSLSDSKKRYLAYMSKQVPHLITRYFV